MAEQLERYAKRLREVWIGLIFLVGALGLDEGHTLWPLSWDVAINFAVCVQFMLRWSQGNDDLTSATFSRFAEWHQGRSRSSIRARFWHLVFYYSVTIVIFGAMVETVSSRHWFHMIIVALLVWDLYLPVFDERARFTWINGRYFLRRLLRRDWSQLGLWDALYSPQFWVINNLFAAAGMLVVQALAMWTPLGDIKLATLTLLIALYNAYIDCKGTHLEVHS